MGHAEAVFSPHGSLMLEDGYNAAQKLRHDFYNACR